MTAEKGEHERAPSVGEIYLSPLRATLRAPPPKWAIKAFFPECRAAGFLWYFLSLRKKVLPSSGRQPHRPRRSRRVKPPQPSWRIALLAVGFPLPPEHRKSVSTTMVWQVPSVPGRVAIHRCLQGGFPLPLPGALIEKSKRHPQSRKFDSRAIVARHAFPSIFLGKVHSRTALSPFPTNRNIPRLLLIKTPLPPSAIFCPK